MNETRPACRQTRPRRLREWIRDQRPELVFDAFCNGYETGAFGLPCEDWGEETLELIEVWKAGWNVGHLDYEQMGEEGDAPEDHA